MAAATTTTTKSLVAAAMMLVVVLAAAHPQAASGQDCSAGLGQLTACAPFMVPGVSTGHPNQQCCSALKNVDPNCLCSTIEIINNLPTTCNLPPVTCNSAK